MAKARVRGKGLKNSTHESPYSLQETLSHGKGFGPLIIVLHCEPLDITHSSNLGEVSGFAARL